MSGSSAFPSSSLLPSFCRLTHIRSIVSSSSVSVAVFSMRKVAMLQAVAAVFAVVIAANIAITVWIVALVAKMKTSGPLSSCLSASTLHTSEIRAESRLRMEAADSIRLEVGKRDGANHTLVLDRSALTLYADAFNVRTSRGDSVLSVRGDKVFMPQKKLILKQAVLNSRTELKSPLVRSIPGHDLRLMSLTGTARLQAPQSVSIDSFGDSVSISAARNVVIRAAASGGPRGGHVELLGPAVLIPRLPVLARRTAASGITNGTRVSAVQLCACADSGRLFAVAAGDVCAADYHICTKK